MGIYQVAEMPGWTRVDNNVQHPTREDVKGDMLRNIKTGRYAIACCGSLVNCPSPGHPIYYR